MSLSTLRANVASLPAFVEPADVKLHELGKRENWGTLEALLEPFSLGNFSVVTRAHESALEQVRRKFDESRSAVGWTVVHYFVGRQSNPDDECGPLALLLSLGLDPDVGDRDETRPSHLSGLWGRPNCAKVIGYCRPDLEAADKSMNGRTPLQTAQDDLPLHDRYPEPERAPKRLEVANIWLDLQRHGFPSVARLAGLRLWWAVLHLCRRRLISEAEAALTYGEKNVLEWAQFYHEPRVVEELWYYLGEFFRSKAVFDCHRLLLKLNQPSEEEEENNNAANGVAASLASIEADMKNVKEGLALYANKVDQEGADLQDNFKALIGSLELKLLSMETSLLSLMGFKHGIPPNKSIGDAQSAVSLPETDGPLRGDNPMRVALLGVMKKIEALALSGSMSAVLEDLIGVVKKHETSN